MIHEIEYKNFEIGKKYELMLGWPDDSFTVTGEFRGEFHEELIFWEKDGTVRQLYQCDILKAVEIR